MFVYTYHYAELKIYNLTRISDSFSQFTHAVMQLKLAIVRQGNG